MDATVKVSFFLFKKSQVSHSLLRLRERQTDSLQTAARLLHPLQPLQTVSYSVQQGRALDTQHLTTSSKLSVKPVRAPDV